ncbi:MAG: AMP-binding protein [Bacilli bacterium]
MRIIKDLITKLTKQPDDEPWLSYYSKEHKEIEFTDLTIFEYLKKCVGQDKDFIALNYFDTRISYNEFFDKIEQASKSLKVLGVKKGDVVSICMPNTPEAVIMFYAINNIGAVADMIHPLSSFSEIKHYLNESKSRILLLIDIAYERASQILDETLVYKTIIVSAADSMPPILGVGYRLTKGLKTKKPKLTDPEFITWNDFILKGISYNKETKTDANKEDLAIILHSGGTTGKPKGIMISNFNFNALAQQGGVNVIEARPKDKIVTILPIFHGFGLGVCVHCPLCLKVETILVPEFDVNRFYKMMKTYKPNVLAGVPTLWEAMLTNKKFEDLDLSNLKYVVSGGDYLTLSMEERMNNFLRTRGASISISKGYGMTESVAATAYTFDGTNEPGSIGIPMIGNSYCICNPDSIEELELGIEGEICVYGPTLMMGYLNNKSETDKVLIKHKDGKVWLHTGDIGYISPNGVIYFTQRLKRMIVSSGFNIYPNVIEEIISKHPSVFKCCCIGIPHPYKMHVPKVFIVLKENCKESSKIRKELKELCKKELALYSQPKEFEFRTELPKTLYGKVDFKKLEKETENEKTK